MSNVLINCIEIQGCVLLPRMHTDEKPYDYECEICKKTYNTNNELKRHKRLHIREKPYSCDVRQKSYSKSSKLSQHNKLLFTVKE